MFCSQCGTDVGEGATFCPACGRAVEASGGGEPETRRRWRGRRAVFGGLAVLALAAVAAIAVSLVLGDAPEDHAVELVPADVALYATVHLDPSLGQKRATQEVLERAQEAGFGDGSGDSLEDAIGDVITESTPVDYEGDLEPQLGDQIAIYQRAEEDDVALVVATSDPPGSRRAMHRMLEREFSHGYRIVKASYRNQPYEHVLYREFGGAPSGVAAFTVIDGFVVAGSEEDVKASIDAWEGASLASAEQFTQAREKVSDDVLAFAYFDAEPLLDEAREDPFAESDELEPLEVVTDMGPIAVSLAAHDSHLELDLAARAAGGDAAPLQNPSALLKTFPAEALVALSLGDLQGPMRKALAAGSERAADLREGIAEVGELDADSDVASWLGLFGGYVAGDDPDTVEGAIVAETRSSSDSDRALDQLEDYYSSLYEYSYDDYVYESDDGLGFDVSADDETVSVRGDEDRVIVGMGAEGFSTDRALDADGGFGDSEAYRRAADLLGGYEPFLVIDVPPTQRLLEESTEARYDDTYMNDVRGWLSAITTVAAGVRTDGEDLRVRLVAAID